MRLPASLQKLDVLQRSRLRLPFPAMNCVRMAQISAGPLIGSARLFPSHRWNELNSFGPRVLAGYASDFERLVAQVQLGIRELSSVDHGVIAMTECGQEPVSERFRDLMWVTFGTPVYELFLDLDGKLVACECEVHDGWHIESSASFYLFNRELILDRRTDAVRTGLLGYVETHPCPCGRATHRVMPLQPSHRSESDRTRLAAIA